MIITYIIKKKGEEVACCVGSGESVFVWSGSRAGAAFYGFLLALDESEIWNCEGWCCHDLLRAMSTWAAVSGFVATYRRRWSGIALMAAASDIEGGRIVHSA